jgi:Anti-sigma factor N-terminus
MNNGIVLKINRSSVIVLTADGEYLKCKRLLSSYSIGQEIQFPNHAVIVNKQIKDFVPKLVPVTVACVLIFMSFIIVDWNKRSVLAAGVVKVNSQAKLSIVLNTQLKVIDLKAHNEQGKKVINKMDNWKQESLDLVMDELIVEMEKNEVILPDEKITLTGNMEKKYKDKQVKLNKKLNSLQRSNSKINLNKPVEHNDQQKQEELKNEKATEQHSNKQKDKKENSKTDSSIKKNNNQKDSTKESQSQPKNQTNQFIEQGSNQGKDKQKSNKKNLPNHENGHRPNREDSNHGKNNNNENNHDKDNGNNNHSAGKKKNEFKQFMKKERKNHSRFTHSHKYQNRDKRSDRNRNNRNKQNDH